MGASRLDPLFAAIAARPGDEHTAALLAARLGVSERQLSRLFVAEVGVPPRRYVEARRVEFAQRLLRCSSVTLHDAAHMAGFGSTETMRRAFLRQVGRSPGACRGAQ
jgi:transcriptional regulator GlxA family with amidase domain